MLVLANEMFDSPPVFAWVLPVFVRLKPGKEETFSPRHGHVFFVFSMWSTSTRRQTMRGPGGKGQGTPGRGKGKGKGKDKGKGKGKGSGAGVGSTYANPGRPKSFQPTQQDRQRTGNIAKYFRRAETTPQPVAPVFASAQMRGGLEASRPWASPAADVTGHSTEVLDVDAAPASEILAGFLAEYGSGSEDADRSHPD
jgi:hypothetical protein